MEIQRKKNPVTCYQKLNMARINGIEAFIPRMVDHSPIRFAMMKTEDLARELKGAIQSAIRSGFKICYPPGREIASCEDCGNPFAKDGEPRTKCSTCMFPKSDDTEQEKQCPYCLGTFQVTKFSRQTCGKDECKKQRNISYAKKIAELNNKNKRKRKGSK